MLIIRSNKRNWEGKGFPKELPAKIHKDFDDACTDLNSYHFYGNEDGEFVPKQKAGRLEFIFSQGRPDRQDVGRKQNPILNGRTDELFAGSHEKRFS